MDTGYVSKQYLQDAKSFRSVCKKLNDPYNILTHLTGEYY